MVTKFSEAKVVLKRKEGVLSIVVIDVNGINDLGSSSQRANTLRKV